MVRIECFALLSLCLIPCYIALGVQLASCCVSGISHSLALSNYFSSDSSPRKSPPAPLLSLSARLYFTFRFPDTESVFRFHPPILRSVKTRRAIIRPGIVGMRGSMVIRLRPCMTISTPPPHPPLVRLR
ncbi:unnamed protein product, partial [Laminaria digitata]